MNGYLIQCARCGCPVEAVVVNREVAGFRGYAPLADDHERQCGHYPDRVFVHRVAPENLLVIGNRR